ncbi:hypothetical protein BDB00DRAFT_521009 [Zychaea mexicana]|uniref:uncharacterized protein n=1 Tax=Zychaea mexicana TaxID=64656 RepID=UPI0022FE0B08|nr:uncharacterized protein BDB00DRAFT_521009 [Zychaea mexicana]KAI9490944.1 hypothetical protein BDB00DRAFT_521009 [Zychaea mexicana]
MFLLLFLSVLALLLFSRRGECIITQIDAELKHFIESDSRRIKILHTGPVGTAEHRQGPSKRELVAPGPAFGGGNWDEARGGSKRELVVPPVFGDDGQDGTGRVEKGTRSPMSVWWWDWDEGEALEKGTRGSIRRWWRDWAGRRAHKMINKKNLTESKPGAGSPCYFPTF